MKTEKKQISTYCIKYYRNGHVTTNYSYIQDPFIRSFAKMQIIEDEPLEQMIQEFRKLKSSEWIYWEKEKIFSIGYSGKRQDKPGIERICIQKLEGTDEHFFYLEVAHQLSRFIVKHLSEDRSITLSGNSEILYSQNWLNRLQNAICSQDEKIIKNECIEFMDYFVDYQKQLSILFYIEKFGLYYIKILSSSIINDLLKVTSDKPYFSGTAGWHFAEKEHTFDIYYYGMNDFGREECYEICFEVV